MNYLIGDFKSEKEKYIIDTALALNTSGENVIIITKEQGTFNMEQKLLKYSRQKVSTIQVFSFNRLAYYILKEVGDDGLIPLDSLGKTLILRKIIDDNFHDLKFYKNCSNKSGFLDELINLITEFYNYNITIENLNSSSENDLLDLKLKDISLIFEKYNEYTKSDYLTTDQVLDTLSKKIPESRSISNTHIFITDFPNFLPQELKVIKELIYKCKSIYFSFDIPENKPIKYYNDLDQRDIYFIPKNALNKITEIGSTLSKYPKEILLFNREKDLPHDISFLIENFNTGKSYNDECKNIFLQRSQNSYREIENISQEITRLIKTEGYRYRDIGILSGDIEDYKTILSTTFTEYNIPFFVDTKRKVTNMSLSTLIKGIMEIIIYNFSYESVFKVLKTEFFDFAEYELDYFENYCIEYGIKNYKWQFDKFNLGQNKYDLEKINSTKDKILDCFSPLTKKVNNKDQYEVRQLCIYIFDFLTYNQIPEKLEDIIKQREINDQIEVAKEYSQIYNKSILLFERINDILGSALLKLQEFYNIVVSGLDKMDLGLLPSRLDEVFYGSIDRSIFPNVKVLFIIGVNEGKVPIVHKENTIFNDREREELKNKGIILEETSIDKSFREDFNIYSSLFIPREKLYFSYCLSFKNEVLFPSILIGKLLKTFPKLKFMETKDYISYETVLFKKVPSIINKNFNGEDISEMEKSIYSYFYNSSYQGKIKNMERALLNKNENPSLREDTINKLYGNELITSVSKLERFQQCPYSYFLNYNLKVHERDVYELGKLDFGNLFHHILDKFQIYHKSFINMSDKEIEAKIISIVDELIDENNIYKSSKRYENFLTKIIKISFKSIWAIKEHLIRGDFQVYGSEITFNQEENGIIIDIGERKLILTGKVDRVDILDKDNKYIKIIDYKSGNQDFVVEDILNGLNLQLSIYLMTLLEQTKNADVGGMFYFKVKNPVISAKEYDKNPTTALLKEFKMSGVFLHDDNNDITKYFDRDFEDSSLVIPATKLKSGELRKDRSSYLSREEFNQLFKTTETNVKDIGEKILKGNIDVNPILNRDKTPCTYCSYKGICKIDLKDEDKKYRILNKDTKKGE